MEAVPPKWRWMTPALVEKLRGATVKRIAQLSRKLQTPEVSHDYTFKFHL